MRIFIMGKAMTTLPIGQQAFLPECFNNWLCHLAKSDQA